MYETLLITGANGFIGSNSVRFFKQKYNIIAIYNTSIKKKFDGVKYVKKNLKKKLEIDKKIDFIIHAASKTPPKYSMDSCYADNSKIDKNIFNFAKEKKIKKIIFFSSMSAYGDKKKNIITEKTKPIKINQYGKSKRNTEKLFYQLTKKNIQVFILRLPAVLGNGCHSTFLSSLHDNFKNGKLIYISNRNSLYNSCIYIMDLILFINKVLKNKNFKYDIVNVGSKNPISIEKIVNIFSKKFEKKRFKYTSKKSNTYIVSSKKASLKYKLKKISTETTLKKYLNFY